MDPSEIADRLETAELLRELIDVMDLPHNPDVSACLRCHVVRRVEKLLEQVEPALNDDRNWRREADDLYDREVATHCLVCRHELGPADVHPEYGWPMRVCLDCFPG